MGAVAALLKREPRLFQSYVRIRETLELAPRQWRYRQSRPSLSPEARAALDQLRRDGIVMLPDFVPADAVLEMQRVIDESIRDGRFRKPAGTTDADAARIARLNIIDPTLHSARFIQYALNEFLVSVVNAYVGCDLFVSGISVYRTQPVPDPPAGSFLWHYDNTPLQVKAICYLTDVTESDGPLVFVPGTHRRRSTASTFEETRIDEASIGSRERMVCVGKMGTVCLVDTSGVHRAQPNELRSRDVVSAIYDPGTRARRTCFYNLPVPTPFIGSLRPEQRRMLRLPEYAG